MQCDCGRLRKLLGADNPAKALADIMNCNVLSVAQAFSILQPPHPRAHLFLLEALPCPSSVSGLWEESQGPLLPPPASPAGAEASSSTSPQRLKTAPVPSSQLTLPPRPSWEASRGRWEPSTSPRASRCRL
ncbi:uncharacterized protein [Dasypus novemcinctus]|uniref:uncharacterized protein isoform X3 n=1 Tax=Dasypus novemcinctus TaxID=9361 RepID=UPI00265E390B|nr:uncharacterized protein LOC101423537 isoform X3 [Dasypus novemcinctus]